MKELVELIDGLLLGDGCLSKTSKDKNARYEHSCKCKEYIEFIKTELLKHGIDFSNKIYEKPNGYNTGITYQMCSRVNEFLTMQYNRWYSNGKKIVPQDIAISPISLKHWYIGDGCLDSDKGYLRQIAIAAHSFTYDEREFLVEKLSSIGIDSSNRKNGLICIKKKSIDGFLKYIGQCPVMCYQYKWDISKYQSKQPKYKLL